MIRALLLTFLAKLYAAKGADDTDEGSAISARIAFRSALLVSAGAADHRIAFAEHLGHRVVSRVAIGTPGSDLSGPLNLYQGPHFTTRLAACSHVDNLSGPASCQPTGTGASRLFSPSVSKQSQPWLNSLATATLRWKGDLRLSGVLRRSRLPANASPLDEPARRSTFRLSAAAGVTSHTSHLLPVESRNVR